MSRLRRVLGFLFAAALVTAAAPGAAQGAAVPGERVMFVEAAMPPGDSQTVVMDPDGSNESVLFEDSGGLVSPDGDWVIYGRELGRSLWKLPSAGGASVKVLDAPEGTSVSFVDWSPDSQRLALELRTPGEDEHDPPLSDVWVVNIDGSALVNLTDTPVANELAPVWFPDGQRILFTFRSTPTPLPGAAELAVIDGESGGGYEVITDEPSLSVSTYSTVGFLHDARELVVAADPVLDPDPDNPQFGPGDLWRIDVATGEMSMLLGSNTEKNLRLMDMTSDGSTMLYVASGDGHTTLWMANGKGGNRTKLYKKPGVGVWAARFNSDKSLVALNLTDGETETLAVKELGTGAVTTLRSGAFVRSPQWIAPGVLCEGRVATIVGTDGDDTLVGTSGVDVIVGFGGDDVIDGGGGDDVVCAGYGNDVVRGEAGDDILLGGPGQDELRGGAGKDTVLGESGNDSLYGGKGKDLVRGGGGADWIHGQWKQDRLYGELGKDIIYGGEGDDRIRGGNADDHLYGGAGDDDAAGNRGDDVLDGGPGDDVLTGGLDVDVVYGNTGVDTCTAETTHGC